ncbi:hypothetical protein BJX61DRAFT_541663 [Aspergillus egyptiacus]|nr:hypothetical protein BJX61DRAFT_541663 [Aspergillus egyptiacus]
MRRAAESAVRVMSTITPGLDLRVAVIGGFALLQHLPDPKPTDDVDFLVHIADFAPLQGLYPGGPGQFIVSHLVAGNSPLFKDDSLLILDDYAVIHMATGVRVQFHNDRVVPYVPACAMRPTGDGFVAFAPPEDLLVFALVSTPRRAGTEGRSKDADAAVDLFKAASIHGVMKLSSLQRDTARAALPDFIARSDRSMDWWMQSL